MAYRLPLATVGHRANDGILVGERRMWDKDERMKPSELAQ